ncbi:hypothetical protein AMJ52_02945 [candidate division TA06 bacterium DG_78]|uniref:Secretion system C-terminal sorting domain-containing protein n=1 Tax=candidate division TA06 bacterium DG_78 TaxID=1703772 RepID=A0A0S7YI43_UNCT6|nr:MAG: hypothetical protein AMJ52_02945 [candidate division TA06 bacterium DG_78]
MKKCAIILMVMVGLCMASSGSVRYPMPREGTVAPENLVRAPSQGRGVQIGVVGDSRSILGPAGKNIVVSSDGTIAVLYGSQYEPYNADTPFDGITITYSLDMGQTWNAYGPIAVTTPPFRRAYSGIDGCENFHESQGNTFFAWMEAPYGYATCPLYCMLDENVPSLPSFSVPVLLSDDIFPWMPCPAVDPENNQHIIVTGWSYLSGGNNNLYYWESFDGGYTWTDTSLMSATVEDSLIDAGHLRWGKDGYGIFVYHDAGEDHVNRIVYYTETTDSGATWSDPDSVYPLSYINLWWHEFDVEVCRDLDGNNFPVMVHNDSEAGGFTNLFYPDPDDPGGPGAWNWQIINLDAYVNGNYSWAGTTWTVTVGRNSNGGMNVAYEPNLDVILVGFRANYEINPPPVDWEDGDYLGGYVSYNGGRDWRVTRPLTGLIDNPATYAPPIEMAHRLMWTGGEYITLWAFTVWTHGGTQHNMPLYFERGRVLPIRVPGIVEYVDDEVLSEIGMTITPTITKTGGCSVAFTILKSSDVSLQVYDAAGRLVATEFNGHLERGIHTLALDTSGLVNGVYIVLVKAAEEFHVGKLVVTR